MRLPTAADERAYESSVRPAAASRASGRSWAGRGWTRGPAREREARAAVPVGLEGEATATAAWARAGCGLARGFLPSLCSALAEGSRPPGEGPGGGARGCGSGAPRGPAGESAVRLLPSLLLLLLGDGGTDGRGGSPTDYCRRPGHHHPPGAASPSPPARPSAPWPPPQFPGTGHGGSSDSCPVLLSSPFWHRAAWPLPGNVTLTSRPQRDGSRRPRPPSRPETEPNTSSSHKEHRARTGGQGRLWARVWGRLWAGPPPRPLPAPPRQDPGSWAGGWPALPLRPAAHTPAARLLFGPRKPGAPGTGCGRNTISQFYPDTQVGKQQT